MKVREQTKAQRRVRTFEAELDVDRMLTNAQKDGRKIGWLVNKSLRLTLRQMGYTEAVN